MQTGFAAGVGLVPGVGHAFLNFVRIAQVNGQHFVEVAVDDGPRGQQQAFFRVVIGDVGDSAVSKHGKLGKPAAYVQPVFIEGGQRKSVRYDNLLSKITAALNKLQHQFQTFLIDNVGSAVCIKVQRAGYAAHKPVGVRIFAAKDGMYLNHVFLEIQGFQIVGHHEQVGFGRQLVGRVPPVAVGENAQLAGFNHAVEAILDGFEVARRRIGPGGELVRKFRCCLGISLGGRHNVHPVETGKMIQMHQMVMVHEAQVHDITDNIGVVWYLYAKRVFHRMHGGKGMRTRADAADAFNKGPGVARVAAFEDDFNTSENGAARNRIGDDVAVVKVHLATQVPFNAGNGVYNHAAARVLNGITLRSSVFVCHGVFPQLLESVSEEFLVFLLPAWRTILATPCTATPAATPATAATPTVSAVALVPRCGMVVMRS